jgi:hypothetical protein
VTALVYDAGALIAAERDNRRFWEIHRRALRRGERPIVPATVLAQVRRGGAERGLAKVLEGCRVAVLDQTAADLVGALLGAAGRDDIVDAHVVICCLAARAGCVTTDRGDIIHLAEAARTDRRHRFGRRRVAIVAV